MIYTYAECKSKFNTDYGIRKELASGRLRKIRRGIYTDSVYESDLAVIGKTYPYAV